MKKNNHLLFILLTLVCYAAQASGQDSLKTQAKNVVYANVGSLGLWFTASGNYERQLFSTDNKYYSNYYIRACGGAFATWGQEGPYGSLSLQSVFGAKKSHVELGLGLAALFDKTGYQIGISNANYYNEAAPTKGDYTDWSPAVSVGYRYQKPTGGFVFRIGIGYPDGAYLSLGFAF